MYKIIGGDDNEYGPVSAETMRQWIAENRVSGETKARGEMTEWKPLAQFQEFAAVLAEQTGATGTAQPKSPNTAAATPHSSQLVGDCRDEALRAVKAPAIAMIVTAIIGLVFVTLGLIMNMLTIAGLKIPLSQLQSQSQLDPEMLRLVSVFSGWIGLAGNLVGAAIAIVILAGTPKMLALKNHRLAVIISILVMLPCVSPCCVLGLPCGIWALTVLYKPEVKLHFT